MKGEYCELPNHPDPTLELLPLLFFSFAMQLITSTFTFSYPSPLFFFPLIFHLQQILIWIPSSLHLILQFISLFEGSRIGKKRYLWADLKFEFLKTTSFMYICNSYNWKNDLLYTCPEKNAAAQTSIISRDIISFTLQRLVKYGFLISILLVYAKVWIYLRQYFNNVYFSNTEIKSPTL